MNNLFYLMVIVQINNKVKTDALMMFSLGKQSIIFLFLL